MTARITADKARRLLRGTTPGPWSAYQPSEVKGAYRVGSSSRTRPYVGLISHAAGVPGWLLSRSHANEPDPLARDARLIAAAPDLAASVIALEAERDEARAEVERLRASLAAHARTGGAP